MQHSANDEMQVDSEKEENLIRDEEIDTVHLKNTQTEGIFLLVALVAEINNHYSIMIHTQ